MTTSPGIDGAEAVQAAAERDEAAAVADRLVEQARAEGVALTGDGGLLTGLVQQVLQTTLETELTDHLGYEPHAMAGRGTPGTAITPRRSAPRLVTSVSMCPGIAKAASHRPRSRWGNAAWPVWTRRSSPGTPKV